MIKVQNNRVQVTWRGHVYAETLTGYTRDGVTLPRHLLPLPVAYLMGLATVGESPL